MDRKSMDKSDEEQYRQEKGKMRRHSTSKSGGSTKVRQHKSSRRRSEASNDMSVRSDMLTQNGIGEEETCQGGTNSDETGGDKIQRKTSIKGMWKKAVKSLKSNDNKTWLNKKSSIIKKKDESVSEEEPSAAAKDVDPVYSLLKCAADLPKNPKEKLKDSACGGHSASAIASSSSGVTADKGQASHP